jgi:hypothetical protein
LPPIVAGRTGLVNPTTERHGNWEDRRGNLDIQEIHKHTAINTVNRS